MSAPGTCADFRPALGAYVLDALEPAEAAAVGEHLARCSACAAEHARLAGLPELLALSEGLEEARDLPPAVEERVLDAVARERLRTPRRRRLPRRAGAILAATAAAALAVAALVAFLPGDTPSPGYEVTLRPVAGSGASGRAQLESVSGGTAVRLWVRDLPAKPGTVYEVRCEAEGWIASAGTFRTDTRGRAYVTLTTAARRGEYDSIRVVRREPARTTAVLTASL